MNQNIILTEIINLDGKKLGDKVKIGCPILEHPKVKNNLFIHKWGVIEIG